MFKQCLVCTIAMSLFFAMIYRTYFFDKESSTLSFHKTLNEKQKTIYSRIIKERKNIYYTGFTYGLMASLLFLISSIYIKNGRWRCCHSINACVSVLLLSFISYLYYILSPKTEYMVLHLNTREQREKWLDVYKSMQYNYHVSYVYGIIGAGVLSYLF